MMSNDNIYNQTQIGNTMANALVSVRLPQELLSSAKRVARTEGYANIQELTKEALRTHVRELEKEHARRQILMLQGSGKGKAKPLSREQIEKLVKDRFG